MSKHIPMRATIAQAVESQLENDTPPDTRITLRRLQELGYSERDAKEMIGKALACHYYRVLFLQESPDKSVYERDLQHLPVLPWEIDARMTEDAVIRDVLDNENIDSRTPEDWRSRYEELRSTTFTIHNAIIKLLGRERLFESARALGMARWDGFVSLAIRKSKLSATMPFMPTRGNGRDTFKHIAKRSVRWTTVPNWCWRPCWRLSIACCSMRANSLPISALRSPIYSASNSLYYTTSISPIRQTRTC